MQATRTKPALQQTLCFLRRHWGHILLAPVLAVVAITFFHEAAHAAAVWLQGGTITSFRFIPNGQNFGSVSYVFPEGAVYSPELIFLAPYLMWITVAGLCASLAWLCRVPARAVPTVFVWFYAAPIVDVAKSCFEFLLGQSSDIFHALGPPTELDGLVIATLAAAVFVGSYFVQKKLYGSELSLSPKGYVVTTLMAIVAILGLFLLIAQLTALAS